MWLVVAVSDMGCRVGWEGGGRGEGVGFQQQGPSLSCRSVDWAGHVVKGKTAEVVNAHVQIGLSAASW